jgi:tryptophan halogenase
MTGEGFGYMNKIGVSNTVQLTEKPIKQITIVGGGTAGWMAAAYLSNIFKNRGPAITLVESDEIEPIGVGEATIPPFLGFLKTIGIDEKEFIQATHATFKLGIQFDNWYAKSTGYFHPFGKIGRNIDGLDFYHCWLKNNAQGHKSQLMDHSSAAQMAFSGRFMSPQNYPDSPIGTAAYALHIDAALAAKFLRKVAESAGVKRIEGKVTDVRLGGGGFIDSVALANGTELVGDLFLDCTGFRGLLIEQALKTGYDDWSHFLPCDNAVAVQTQRLGSAPPFTVATARSAGWMWRIPLQHRTGNGYAFSSRFCSEDEAVSTLLESVEGELLSAPKVIPFVTGKRRKVWNKNCISLGLASGFVEPLESTAIHLVFKTLAWLVRLFPDADFDQSLQDDFNQKLAREYEEIRDFIVLHYCVTQRDDSPFWRHCREMQIPQSLKEKIGYFGQRGELTEGEGDLFKPVNWYSVLEGMQVRPAKYNPLADTLDPDKLALSISQGSKAIARFVEQLPTHDEFIRQVCPASKS